MNVLTLQSKSYGNWFDTLTTLYSMLLVSNYYFAVFFTLGSIEKVIQRFIFKKMSILYLHTILQIKILRASLCMCVSCIQRDTQIELSVMKYCYTLFPPKPGHCLLSDGTQRCVTVTKTINLKKYYIVWESNIKPSLVQSDVVSVCHDFLDKVTF